MKTKVAYLDVLRQNYLSLFITINGFWVNNNLNDQKMYNLRSSWSFITQKRLVWEKTYKSKSCLSRRFTSIWFIFFWLRLMVYELFPIFLGLVSPRTPLSGHHFLRSARSSITQKRLAGEKTYKNKSCLSRRFTSNSVIFFGYDQWFLSYLRSWWSQDALHPRDHQDRQ